MRKDCKQRSMNMQRNDWGTVLGATSLGLLVLAISITSPHYMHHRNNTVGCDSLCQGSLTSVKSVCNLIGAVFVGKLSDAQHMIAVARPFGGIRRMSLWVGIAATAVSIRLGFLADSTWGLSLSIIPAALLQQNSSVLKAVLLSEFPVSSDGERASSVGKLGMAVGLAMMLGPVLGVAFFPTYEGAMAAGYLFLFLSALLVALLPIVAKREIDSETNKSRRSILSILDVPAARSPAGMFYFACRLCSSLSYFIYQTIWTVAQKDRFHFQPTDYGQFMSLVGLFLALSQGYGAGWILERVCGKKGRDKRNRAILLSSCSVIMGLCRFLSFQTTSLIVVYVLFAIMVTALGVMSTILTTDATQIADDGEVSSFLGVQVAIESAAGTAGPLLGGTLGTLMHPVKAPLALAVFFNAFVACFVLWGYDSILVRQSNNRQKQKSQLYRKKGALLKETNQP